MKQTIYLFFVSLFFISCGAAKRLASGSKTAHEKYADKLKEEGWKKTPQGQQWLAASQSALQNPQQIDLPYKHTGNFPSDKPRALGLKFRAKRGEQLTFNLFPREKNSYVIYADVYKEDSDDATLVYAAEKGNTQFSIDINETGNYILRLQPELFHKGEYTLNVTTGPSLAFPVSGNKAKPGSFWGASRGGGKRLHEGIDIFAPKHTPAVAAADGIITNVSQGGLGGKVVWLRPAGKNITLYYAHLDKQMVQNGQIVKQGDVIGLVGNTGNAKTTPSHLHFGIYSFNGPVDPLPFVDKSSKPTSQVPDKKLTHYLKLIKAYKPEAGEPSIQANALILPIAVNAKGYFGELPDGRIIHFPFSSVQVTNQQLSTPGANTAMLR